MQENFKQLSVFIDINWHQSFLKSLSPLYLSAWQQYADVL
jgi:hypothetical protein